MAHLVAFKCAGCGEPFGWIPCEHAVNLRGLGLYCAECAPAEEAEREEEDRQAETE